LRPSAQRSPASNNCLRCLGQSLSYFAIVIRAARAATQD
jgi:hypothetical protein